MDLGNASYIKSFVENEGAPLGDGDTLRTLCPACMGGRSKERSFSITRAEGRLLYHCYRGRCGVKGAVGGKAGNLIRITLPRKVYPELKLSAVVEHPPAVEQIEKFHINAELVSRMGMAYYEHSPDDGRIAWTMWNPDGAVRGYVRRGYDGQQPKALSWLLDPDDVSMSWHIAHRDPNYPCVVVEDIPSAVRIQQSGFNAVALTGSTPSKAQMAEMIRTVPNVVWCLDPDATDKSLKWNRQWGLFFKTSRVLPVVADVKDMTDGVYKEWLKEIS